MIHKWEQNITMENICNFKLKLLEISTTINNIINIGRSHNKSYTLYQLNQKATEGLKLFAENGRSDYLDTQSQGEGGIYDEFNAPPITSGEGKTEAEFFVDGNHSRVRKLDNFFYLVFEQKKKKKKANFIFKYYKGVADFKACSFSWLVHRYRQFRSVRQ